MIAEPNVKLNLGLNVLRKRPDGYHDLSTLFVPYLGIRDTLEIVPGDDYSRTSGRLFDTYGSDKLAQAISPDGKLMITVARAEGVDWDPLSDLTAKAYGILAEDFTLPVAKIFLEKKAPVGAGPRTRSSRTMRPGWGPTARSSSTIPRCWAQAGERNSLHIPLTSKAMR